MEIDQADATASNASMSAVSTYLAQRSWSQVLRPLRWPRSTVQQRRFALQIATLPPSVAIPRLKLALESGWDATIPDVCLLASNAMAVSPASQAAFINRYLGRFDLAPITLNVNELPAAIHNLQDTQACAPIGTGPLVTVLMPAYDAERRVGSAMRSILGQSWQNLELIVIDDASADNTWQRILDEARNDRRIIPLKLPRNVGPFAAKLIGLQHARGELITCHDADDWSHPLKLERQISPLLQNGDLVATTSCWVRMDDNGHFHARQRYPLMRWNPSSTLFRRDPVLKRAGAWDPVRTGADSEFLDRLKAVFGAHSVHRVSQPLAFGSHRPGSLTTDATTGFDDQGRSHSREAYATAWRQWHARLRRRGSTPWMAPNLEQAATHRPFAVPPDLRIPFADIEACQASAGRPGFMDDEGHRPAWLSTSAALGRIPTLPALLEGEILDDTRSHRRHPRLAGVLAWGRKPSARLAQQRADRLGLSVRWIEDGLLRSFLPGPQYPPLSILVDDVGVSYDATRPSALETLLNSGEHLLGGDAAGQVAQARALILEHGLSKYNHAPSLRRWRSSTGQPLLRRGDRQRILVVDQTAGDLSIACGAATARCFGQMLEAALSEHPDATVYIKTHPEVSMGRKQGHFAAVQDNERVVVLRQPIEPLSLIQEMDLVFVVSSTLGFEAVMAGKPVTCFGIPWYAGWGATTDRLSTARRTRRRTIDELFAAAYLRCSRYVNPETHRRGTVFDVIHWLSRQRRLAGLV